MSTDVQIPSFDFSAFYYQQLLDALVRYKRENVPELTDESEFEPSMQFLRAFALVGHLNNTLLDVVANESTLPTAQLVESVRNHLRLIGYEMSPATPAQVELLYTLSRVFTSDTEIVPALAQASTRRSGSDPVIIFEANEALTVVRTDRISAGWSLEGSTYTDRTVALRSSAPGDDFAPWAAPVVGDALYIGHTNAMWDSLAMEIATAGSGILGIWEYYDSDWAKVAPDSVTPSGATMTVVVNGLLGTSPCPGTEVRVTLNETGVYDTAISLWNGSQNYVTVGILGQSTPSSVASDYSVGSDWTELDATDGTADLTLTGNVEYTLPQSVDENWIQGTVNGVEAYWLRYRIIAVSTPVSPVVRSANISGSQYIMVLATQGQTTSDDPLGSSTGLPDQRFLTSQENFIKNSQTVEVDSVEWTEVVNFVNSKPTERHYVVELGENDQATIVFGSGSAGKVPDLGVNNISVTYRYDAQDDGNVGPNTITVNRHGLTYINSLTNPRQAGGWREADGASTASLERVKQEGPDSLRAMGVALGPDDVVTMTKAYTDALGAKLFSRAVAIEEGLGPKTIMVVVVLQGGAAATLTQLQNLATYFNGDKYAIPVLPQRIVANQQVTGFNYTQHAIDVTATVTTTATVQQIVNRLTQLLHPEAIDPEDGVTFEWDFGDEVTTSRIIHEIFAVEGVITKKVVLSTPASDIQLGDLELPVVGTLAITVVEP